MLFIGVIVETLSPSLSLLAEIVVVFANRVGCRLRLILLYNVIKDIFSRRYFFPFLPIIYLFEMDVLADTVSSEKIR